MLKTRWTLMMLLLLERRFPEEDKIHDVMWLNSRRHVGDCCFCAALYVSSLHSHVLYSALTLSSIRSKDRWCYLKVVSWPFNHQGFSKRKWSLVRIQTQWHTQWLLKIRIPQIKENKNSGKHMYEARKGHNTDTHARWRFIYTQWAHKWFT